MGNSPTSYTRSSWYHFFQTKYSDSKLDPKLEKTGSCSRPLTLAQMASLRNPLRGSGSEGGKGSAFPRMRCSTYLGLSSPLRCRILKVSIEETMSLCFSKRPLRVKWKETCEMESISWVILTLRSYSERISFSYFYY